MRQFNNKKAFLRFPSQLHVCTGQNGGDDDGEVVGFKPLVSWLCPSPQAFLLITTGQGMQYLSSNDVFFVCLFV